MSGNALWSRRAWHALTQDVQKAYEDVSAPRRAFVTAAELRQPYQALRADLATVVSELTDDTDVNCDVCFSYLLASSGLHFVRLSMVGPYAAVARLESDGAPEYITPGRGARSEVERDVFRLLESHGLQVLSESQLGTDIGLTLPDVRQAKVYNALFSPEEEFSGPF